MKITKAFLYVDNIERTKNFYVETLGFNKLSETTTSFEIQVGSSIIGFELDPLYESKQYHFAFNIPENLFIEAKEWIKRHTSLLIHREKDEIFFESINAHSVYFYDSEENVVELIARHALNPAKNVQHFTAQDILDIAEMNLTTNNLLEAGEKLKEIGVSERHHLPLDKSGLNFLGEPGDGTHILLGPNGRNWFFSPKEAVTSPIMIELNNQYRLQLDTKGILHYEMFQKPSVLHKN